MIGQVHKLIMTTSDTYRKQIIKKGKTKVPVSVFTSRVSLNFSKPINKMTQGGIWANVTPVAALGGIWADFSGNNFSAKLLTLQSPGGLLRGGGAP